MDSSDEGIGKRVGFIRSEILRGIFEAPGITNFESTEVGMALMMAAFRFTAAKSRVPAEQFEAVDEIALNTISDFLKQLPALRGELISLDGEES